MKTDVTRVAIVDDHALIREAVSSIISVHPNFKLVLEARHGKDLLAQLETIEKLPDICITDINMPMMNGYETCLALKAKHAKIKVIALSMLTDNSAIIKMLNSGMDGYLHKDISPDDLINALTMLNTEGFYYPQNIYQFIFKALQDKDKKNLDFTSDEIRFLQECCKEKTYKEIAIDMDTTTRAIEWLRDSMFKKLDVNSRTGLVMASMRLGVLYME